MIAQANRDNVADFLNRVEHPRRSGRGWVARCPAHNDRSPSLSISEGDDGRVLTHCFAGCTAKEIVSAMGLTLVDLFADSTTSRDTIRRRALKQKRRRASLADSMIQGVYREAEAVLRTATGVDISTWTPAEIDAAMSAVCTAYDVLQKEREGT